MRIKKNHYFFKKCCGYSKELSKLLKIVSEYDQEIPQSQTADNPMAPRGRAATPGRQIKQSNQLSSPSR